MAEIINMPKLSDTMTVGILVKWLKKEGDAVKFGDLIAEIETDKATMEFEHLAGDGTILKIYAPAGSQVAIGAPLCAVGKAGEVAPEAPSPAQPKAEAPREEKKADPSAAPSNVAPSPEVSATPAVTSSAATAGSGGPAPATASAHSPSAPVAIAPGEGERIRISPLARKLAAEKGVDFSRLKGTGPGGRIVRVDILAAEKAGPAPKAATPTAAAKNGAAFAGGLPSRTGPIQEEKSVPVSNMRGVIAKRLLESKTQIPHFYLEIEVDAGPLLELRQQLNTGLEKEGVKLSVNDFILKACAEALRRVPAVNCSWEGTAIKHHPAAHVSFAVAIEDGLITPVVRDTHLKSVFQISTEAKSLAKLAKEKKLQPNQYTGGTFCVSNLGMMGIDRFSAIINPPNAAILAVGTTVKKPVVKNDQIVIGQRLSLTLSTDHRVVDGAVGATFLGALKSVIESPALLLV